MIIKNQLNAQNLLKSREKVSEAKAWFKIRVPQFDKNYQAPQQVQAVKKSAE